MRTKIVYVLVSQETDYYYEMLLLSLYSLRLRHPKGDAEVEVVMDEDTHQRLVGKQAEMLSDVTPVVVHIPEEYTVMQRSRYLKTRLRQLVKGDFLFLDTDTLVCEKLNDIDEVDASVAMSAEIVDEQSKAGWVHTCKKAGFLHLEERPMFNSGVMLVKQAPQAFELFEQWHQNWLVSIKNSINMDQPSLWQTNASLGELVTVLPVIWNCRMFNQTTAATIDHAKVFHYCPANGRSLVRHLLFEHIKSTEVIDQPISNVARSPRTVGYSAFSASDNRILSYLFSDMLYTYEITPPNFKTLLFLAHRLTSPVLALSRWKHRFLKAINRK